MDYVRLGNTDIVVSKLCFGGLVMGPLQKNLPPVEGAAVILRALQTGVNFIDTAELYGTYPHIRQALALWEGERPVIATKSYAWSREDAEKSLERARKELDCDVIDIFLMHEQESRLTLAGHRQALEYYLNEREKGRIRAVGVSTHHIEVVEACSEMPEIDVLHPIVNRTGMGIADGNVEQMLHGVKTAYSNGKGIYSMKPLGGGNLLGSYVDSMRFVLDLPFIHSIAVGMQSVHEVEMNVCVFEGRPVPDEVGKAASMHEKRLHIDYWCEGCGKCLERCGQGALRLENGKAAADPERCVLCGYCGSVCKAFAIKIC